MLASLTQSDLKARYGRGPWRLVKWLADPFAALGVYLLLVSFVLDRGGRAPGLSIACAVVPFQLLMMSIVNSMSSLDLRRSIVLNVRFARTLIPTSATLTEMVAFGASLGLMGIMMAVYRVTPTPAVLWLPLVIAVNAMFAVACAYVASLFSLWFQELRVFALSVVRTLFFLAAGLVPLSAIRQPANGLIRLNPLTAIFESYRDVLLYARSPLGWHLWYPLVVAAVLLAVVLPLYRREQAHFAKVLSS